MGGKNTQYKTQPYLKMYPKKDPDNNEVQLEVY
jgi:hypothetical protein